ncbi:hypothetical protein ACS0TY_020514 [Phlomoides rotata]
MAKTFPSISFTPKHTTAESRSKMIIDLPSLKPSFHYEVTCNLDAMENILLQRVKKMLKKVGLVTFVKATPSRYLDIPVAEFYIHLQKSTNGNGLEIRITLTNERGEDELTQFNVTNEHMEEVLGLQEGDGSSPTNYAIGDEQRYLNKFMKAPTEFKHER